MTTDTTPPEPPAPPGAAPPSAGSGIHRRLTLNSISNVSRYAISLLVAFFLTPYVVRTLGDSQYGFWVVLFSFVGYAGILEMGVQPAIVRLVGRTRGEGDFAKLEELVTAAFFFFSAVGILSALAFWVALPPILPRFVRHFQLLEGAGPLFALIALDIAVMFLNYLFAGVLYGWQLYHAKNLIDIGAWILNAVLVVLFLDRGGLVMLAAIKTGTDVLALAATFAVCRRDVPRARIRPSRLRRSSFRELMSFGGKVFISSTAARFATYAQPIIVSSMISAAATAFFSIPVRLVEYARQIVYAMATGFMPMFSELDGRKEQGLIRSIYVNYSRYILLTNLPVLVLIFVYGRDFIRLWISEEYAREGGGALMLLTAAALIEGFQPLLWRLFLGVGRLGVLVTVHSLSSVATVILSVILIRPYGITGVAFAVLLTTLLAQVVFTVYVSRYLQLSLGQLLLQIHWRPVLANLAFGGLMVGVFRLLGAEAYPDLLVGAGIGVALYMPLAYGLSLRGSERSWVRGKLSRMVSSRRATVR